MAFTVPQKLSICKILKIDLLTLDQKLVWYADNITAETETAVITELDRWEAGAGTNFISTEPNNRNFGARLDPGAEKNDIRSNIATLLFLTDVVSGGQVSNEFAIERG